MRDTPPPIHASDPRLRYTPPIHHCAARSQVLLIQSQAGALLSHVQLYASPLEVGAKAASLRLCAAGSRLKFACQ